MQLRLHPAPADPRRRRAGACDFGRKLRRRPEAGRRAAAAGGDRRHAGQAHGVRFRRICRPLRRRQFGRGARARFRLSRQRAFQGRADGQEGRSAVHHRQAAVPERGRAGARQSDARRSPTSPIPNPISSAANRWWRQKTITEQIFEQRSQAFRNAQASVSGAEAALRQAELDLEFTELRAPIDGRIGDRRVSPGNLVAGGTIRSTTLLATIVSTDPIHFEFTFDEASYLRYERLAKDGRDVASRGAGVQVALKLIDEQRLRARRPHGFRQQRDRQQHRHHPRPRHVRQSERRVHARHVRPRARAGLAALRGAAGARFRHRLRADAQICSCRRPRQQGRPSDS